METYEQGYRARVSGIAIHSNPHNHTFNRSDWMEWGTGWDDANEDIRWTNKGSAQMQFGLQAPKS